MLTIRVMRNGAGYAKKYLEQSDYYAEGEKVTGQWFGKGAEKLGLTGKVLHEQFERVRVGLHPETGEKLRQRKARPRIERPMPAISTTSRFPLPNRSRSWPFSAAASGSWPHMTAP